MASAVTSIYEYPISAASAAYAPTNTAEVTAMIDSAVSGKLDSSASSAFQPSGNYQTAGDYVSSSELADFQTTAGMSAYQPVDGMSAYQSAGDYATTADLSAKLDASASSAFLTSQVQASWSETSSSSPAYIVDRPTEGTLSAGDYMDISVSGNVVTLGVTGVATTADLSAKLDASASSAFITSTAGLVSTGDLENYQTTAGMSAYATTGDLAEKLDASASSAFITSTAGLVSTGDLENYQTTAGMSGYATTGDLSAYLEASAIETSTAGVTGIAGTAIAGGGGASIPFIGYYWDSAASATAEITAAVSSVSSLPYEKYDGTKVNAYKGITDSLGLTHLGVASFIEPGAQINNKSYNYTLAFAPSSSMWTTAGVATGIYAPLQYGTGAGMFIDNYAFKGFLKGNEIFICNTGIGKAVRIEAHQSRNARVGLTGDSAGATTANFTPSEISFCSAGYATSTYGRTKIGFSSTASGTAAYGINYITLYDSDASSQKTISSTSIDYWNGKLDGSSIETSTAGVTGIGGTAIAGGGGGASYTAGQYIQISGDEISVTGIDPNSYATTGDLSAKLDASASSAFLTAQEQASWSETASSSPSYIVDKPDLVDIVAGTGIAVDNPDGNTMRITNTGFPVSTTDAVRCGTFKGDPMYMKNYTFTGTVGNSETTINMSIDEKLGTGGINRIWIDMSNSFVLYGSSGNIFMPLSWRLGSARGGGVSVINASAGSLTCRCIDTSATPLTFSITIRYTVTNA